MAINKLYLMVPIMLASRKLDSEDPTTILLLRCSYGIVQFVIVLLVSYIYVQASSAVNTSEGKKIIYVSPQATPFADPNAKKTYTEALYGQHVLSLARNLLGSTLFGIVLTTALHYYRGAIVGFTMQSVMGPFSLFENPLAKMYFTSQKGNHFGEKSPEELTDEDEIVDAAGAKVVLKKLKGKEKGKGAPKEGKEERSFEDVLLDTWDLGAEADIQPMMNALTKKNINYRTVESEWSPLMLMCGLKHKDSSKAIVKMIQMGASLTLVDGEGWNCLHWSCFHGSSDAAKTVLENGGWEAGIVDVVDKEGKTALDHAEAEDNDDVVKAIDLFLAERLGENKETAGEEGLRRRKKKETSECKSGEID